MKEFDHEGLLLASFQGQLFEKSYELNCSTSIFIRRFKYSKVLMTLDRNDTSLLSLDVVETINALENQFGPFTYGTLKFSKSSLFWIGYVYRYISYTRCCKTRFVMQLFDYKLLNNLYYVYHTQDMEWVVKSLLNQIGESEDIFDNNLRLKEVILKLED